MSVVAESSFERQMFNVGHLVPVATPEQRCQPIWNQRCCSLSIINININTNHSLIATDRGALYCTARLVLYRYLRVRAKFDIDRVTD